MKPQPTEEKLKFDETYGQLKAFVAKQKGPALALATAWHLDQVKCLEQQCENLRSELTKT